MLESCPAYGSVTMKERIPASSGTSGVDQDCMEVYEDMTGYREDNNYEEVNL